MGKIQLFSAFAMGQSITLRDRGLNQDVTGQIQCIYLESGFHLPEQPRHFMVRIVVEKAVDGDGEIDGYVGTTREVYVNTVD